MSGDRPDLLAALQRSIDDAKAARPTRAPVNGMPGGTIAWAEHLQAWQAYARTYGTSQSAQRIAQRGGFGLSELVTQLGRMPETWEPGPGTRFLAGVEPAAPLRVRLVAELAEHEADCPSPECPRHAGPLFCRPCSEAASEWVPWHGHLHTVLGGAG